MSRIVKKPELRRQELVAIALRQFIDVGYDKTSIRSIVKEAHGEIGMFYHHFTSKDEIFEAALQQYNSVYIAATKKTLEENQGIDFLKLVEKMLQELVSTLSQYHKMQPQNADKATLTILHQSTLKSLHLIFCEVITDYVNRNMLNLPNVEISLLTDFILYGTSAIIHSQNITDMKIKIESIKVLLAKILDI